MAIKDQLLVGADRVRGARSEEEGPARGARRSWGQNGGKKESCGELSSSCSGSNLVQQLHNTIDVKENVLRFI